MSTPERFREEYERPPHWWPELGLLDAEDVLTDEELKSTYETRRPRWREGRY